MLATQAIDLNVASSLEANLLTLKLKLTKNVNVR